MTDAECVQSIIESYGNARQAALAFNAEMERAGLDYRMNLTSTMQRISQGKATPAMLALVRLTLGHSEKIRKK